MNSRKIHMNWFTWECTLRIVFTYLFVVLGRGGRSWGPQCHRRSRTTAWTGRSWSSVLYGEGNGTCTQVPQKRNLNYLLNAFRVQKFMNKLQVEMSDFVVVYWGRREQENGWVDMSGNDWVTLVINSVGRDDHLQVCRTGEWSGGTDDGV